MPRSRSKPAGALDMLKDDHDKVRKAFRKFQSMAREDAQACRSLILEVCEELKLHTTLEEEVFYPAVRDAIDDEDVMNEAAVEHETAKILIEQLENMEADDPNYHATFTVLGEYVRHHIEEEEGEMFPAARKAELDLEELGGRLRQRREELAGEPERQHA